MKRKSKSGISLIVLVITIIVIIILAVAVILNIANNNPIDNAKKATDAWNKREELESLNLCLTQYFAEGNNTSLADYIKNNFELQEKVEDSGSSVVVMAKYYGYVIDKDSKKILVQSEKDIIEEISAVKKEYEAYRETALAEKTTTLEKPYNNEGRYSENDSALVAILPSYNKDNYRLSLQRGNLVCLYDLSVMTEEKIKVCQALNIYLLGDINGDNKLYFDDYRLLQRDMFKSGKTEREKITMDMYTDGNDVINQMDVNTMLSKLTSVCYSTINIIKNEYTENVKKELNEGISRDNINANTVEEMKKYAPSYDGNLGYKFKIQKRVLLFVYDKNLDPDFITHSGIKLMGDVNTDGKLDNYDLDIIKSYIEDSSKFESLVWEGKQVADLNADGVIDNQDLEMFRSLINS